MEPWNVFILLIGAAAGTLIGWRGRHRLRGLGLGFLAGAAVNIGIVVALSVIPSGPSGDYRDPVQLAKAVKAQEHSYSASCGKLPTGKYFCAVANLDGTSASYTVTVSADGRGYTVG